MDRIEELRTFVAVADLRSFAQAARRLLSKVEAGHDSDDFVREVDRIASLGW